jgi:transposase
MTADRRSLRYPSDLSGAEWGLIAPMIPPARRGGRRRSVDVREVLNAIFYVLSTGCQWKAMPKDLPPRARRIFISCYGTGTAPSIVFTTHSM